MLLVAAPTGEVGVMDIVVFETNKTLIPVVHRVVGSNGTHHLTKGDANAVADTFLYDDGKTLLEHKHIVGRVIGHVPLIGYPSLWLGKVAGPHVAARVLIAALVCIAYDQKSKVAAIVWGESEEHGADD